MHEESSNESTKHIFFFEPIVWSGVHILYAGWLFYRNPIYRYRRERQRRGSFCMGQSSVSHLRRQWFKMGAFSSGPEREAGVEEDNQVWARRTKVVRGPLKNSPAAMGWPADRYRAADPPRHSGNAPIVGLPTAFSAGASYLRQPRCPPEGLRVFVCRLLNKPLIRLYINFCES